MTLPSTDTTITLPGDGSTTSFNFSFKVWESTDLEVWITDEDDIVTPISSNWSVALNSNQDADPGGAVTYPVTGDPLTEYEKITIKRGMPFTQLTKFSRGQGFDPIVMGAALDRIKAELQELLEIIQRSIRVPVSKGGVDTRLPSPVANHFLAWNATADAIINAAGQAGAALVTPYMATVLAAEDVDEALTALGVGAFARTLLDDEDADDALSTLGVKSLVDWYAWVESLMYKQSGLTWASFSSANTTNEYMSVAWSPELGLLAAVARTGTNTIQTSPDGRNWTEQVAPWKSWQTIIWAPGVGGGEGLFVAIGYAASDNELVMTSPDGINWTLRTVPGSNNWSGLAYSPELGLFVATAYSGSSTGQYAMSSIDAVTWTLRNTPADEDWVEVKWIHELSLFVAISCTGPAGQTVMTSSDGTTWTLRNTPADNSWRGLAWSPDLNLLVAVGYSGTGDRIMTSPDGINWTLRSSPADNSWYSVEWSPELGIFVAVAGSGSDPRAMTSDDGINWKLQSDGVLEDPWRSIVWAPEIGQFCAVSSKDFSNKVMLSGIYMGH